MKKYNLKDYLRGWVVGNIEPNLIKNKDIEVGIKYFKPGESEPAHLHKIVREFTIVVSGDVKMNNKIFSSGDIIEISPGEIASFESLTDSILVILKTPSVPSDKYVQGNVEFGE